MDTFYSSVSFALAVTSCISTLILQLVLTKGELCPGQRSRIQRQLGSVASLVTLAALFSWQASEPLVTSIALSVAAVMGWLQSFRLSRLKPKQSIALNSWWLFSLPLCLAALSLVYQHLLLIVVCAVSGAALAHCLLVRAKYRLEAFNQLLPYAGLAAAMLAVLLAGIHLANHQPVSEVQQYNFMYFAAALLASLALWLWPLLKQIKPHGPTLTAVAMGCTVASYQLHSLIV